MLALAGPALAAEKVLASRVWPAMEYTRVTFETARPVKHAYFFVTDPDRLVLDLEGVELGEELRALSTKVGADDPYIKTLRVGVNRPGVVRVVFDLRSEVKPSVFPLAPAGEYKHRLVLDLYPAKPADPLLALITPKADPIGEIAASQAPSPQNPPYTRPPSPFILAMNSLLVAPRRVAASRRASAAWSRAACISFIATVRRAAIPSREMVSFFPPVRRARTTEPEDRSRGPISMRNGTPRPSHS